MAKPEDTIREALRFCNMREEAETALDSILHELERIRAHICPVPDDPGAWDDWRA